MGIFAGAIDYFQRGGACMWPLLLCSLAAIAIGVERYLYYKKALSSTDFVMEFCRLMNDFNIVGAREFAGMNKGDAAELATETLDINEDLGKRLESIVYSKADRAIDGMEQNLDYLSVVIGLAPMLGLLGTITGMISSFNALNERKGAESDGGNCRYWRGFDNDCFWFVYCDHGYVHLCVFVKQGQNCFVEYLRGRQCVD